MTLEEKYPSLKYLIARARKRIPFFAWEYLASGTGAEILLSDNRIALDSIKLTPAVLPGRFKPDTKTTLLGQTFSVPFGAGPVGMSGLIWPGSEQILARSARDHGFPYTLSMVANEMPEMVSEIAGDNAWFQLYPMRDPSIQSKILSRIWDAGYRTLMVTVDVPIGSRRERQLAAGLTVPAKMTPSTIWRAAKRPAWTIATLRHGMPRFLTLDPYIKFNSMQESGRPVARVIEGRPDWDDIKLIRNSWKGNFVLKGILRGEDAGRAIEIGADGIVVSNHGGRQFDAAPAAIDALPRVVGAVAGAVPVLFDSGIRSGLDIIRALSLGADFCLLGRGFLYAVAALGRRGGDHASEILKRELENNMMQLGAKSLEQIGEWDRDCRPS